jgi:hypothetical protein
VVSVSPAKWPLTRALTTARSQVRRDVRQRRRVERLDAIRRSVARRRQKHSAG